jgi:hypothetical protein
MAKEVELTKDQIKNMSDLLLYTMANHYEEQISKKKQAGKALGLVVSQGYIYIIPIFDLSRLEERDFIAMMIEKINPMAFSRGTKMMTEHGEKTLEILTVDPYRSQLLSHPIQIDDQGNVSQRDEDEAQLRDLKPDEFYPYRDSHIYSQSVRSNPDRALTDHMFEVFYSTLGGAAEKYDYTEDWDRLVLSRTRTSHRTESTDLPPAKT